MEVILAESFGMCFGVRDAVELALTVSRSADLTVLGELVHNDDVLTRLGQAGIRTAPGPDTEVSGGHVMVTAHGVAHSTMARLRGAGLEVWDATCPLVRHAHRSLARLVAAGYFPVIIGRRDHAEVRGLAGDLHECAVVEVPDDLAGLAGRPALGVVSQTTHPLAEVRRLVELMRKRFPEADVRFVDTVCQPTKDRQTAAERLAATCDLVVVVGGRGSNNTRQLLRTCERAGARGIQVERASQLRAEWFAGARRVGLTAGTSTPDDVVRDVHSALLAIERKDLPPARELAAA